jgi:hypothetical protein
VQVAVAGVEDVGDDQPVLVAERGDPVEHLRQLRARDHPVLDEVVRRDPAHRRERRLAGLPEALALFLVARHAHVVGAVALADRGDLVEAGLALALGAVELDQQRRAAHREAGLGRLLGRLDRLGVHHLDRSRDDAALDDLRHGLAGLVRGVEERHQRAHGLRRGDHAQPHLGRHAERALGADERAEQVIARRVELVAADLDHLAVGEHELQAGHVVGREAVLEAVGAARVLGDVAADRADDLARRVRRVEVRGRHGGGHRRVGHAGLDAHPPVVEVDLEDPLHPREHEQHAVLDRQRAAGEPGAGAARDERHLGPRARAHHVADLLGGAREHRRGGDRVVLQQAVGLVGPQLVLLRVHPLVADDPAQLAHELAQVALRRVGLRRAGRDGGAFGGCG